MTIKLCIRPSKRRTDGRYTLYFSFADRGQTKFAAADVSIAAPHNLKNGQIIKEPNANYHNAKLNQYLIDYQRRYDALADWQRALPLPQIIELLRGSPEDNTSFAAFAQRAIDGYKRRGQGSYLTKEYALQKFNAKFGALSIKAITRRTLDDFVEHLRGLNLRETTISICVREIKAIYHLAQAERLVSRDDDPFFKYPVPKWTSRDAALTIEQLKTVRDVPLARKLTSFARDIFMIIFYLGGVNFVDLINLKPPADGRIAYERQKTRASKRQEIPVSLAAQPELTPYIEKYKGGDTLFDFGYDFASPLLLM